MKRAVRVLVAVAALVAAAATGAARAPAASAADDSTAVVVIDTGGSVRSAVIHFDGTINGIDALQLAHANPVTYGFAGQGAAVCALDGVGNPADQSCLIGPNSEYWAYYVAHSGSTSWAYSRGCACTTTVQDGDVEGWRYGTGAAPRASADFCSYSDCGPPPPPPTSPSSGDSGGAGSGNSSSGATGGPPGGSSGGSTGTQIGGTPQPGVASGPTDPGTGGTSPDDPAVAGATTSTTAPTSTSTTRPHARDDDRAQAVVASRGGGGDDGAGSPVGVAVAAGVLAVVAVGTVWLRRRRARAGI